MEPIVYEDDLVIAFADKHPVSEGHTLVVPKIHVENIFSTSEALLAHIVKVSKHLAKKYKSELGATGINILNANGKDADQSIFHLHFHVVPRYPDDGLNMWFHTRERI